MNALHVITCLALFCPPETAEQRHWLQQLGHDSFHVREAATKNLLASPVPMSTLTRWTKHHDPEIRNRVRRIIAEKINRQLDTLEPFPYIDSAWFNPKTRLYECCVKRDRLEIYLHRAGGGDPRPWTNYRIATRLYVGDLLRRGVPLWWIDRLILADMRRREKAVPECWGGPKKNANRN